MIALIPGSSTRSAADQERQIVAVRSGNRGQYAVFRLEDIGEIVELDELNPDFTSARDKCKAA